MPLLIENACTLFRRRLPLLAAVATLAVLATPVQALAQVIPLDITIHVKGVGDYRGGIRHSSHRDTARRLRPFGSTIAGTTGHRIELVNIRFLRPPAGLSLEYKCHLQKIGDTGWVRAGRDCGTRGQSRRLEGISIRLTGRSASRYKVVYWCDSRWQGFKLDKLYGSQGSFCGSRGKSLPLTYLEVAVIGPSGADVGATNLNLPGNDYRSFPTSSRSWLACRNTCRQERPCKAWSYVRSGIQGARAICWLKDSIPAPPKPNNCCVSGDK